MTGLSRRHLAAGALAATACAALRPAGAAAALLSGPVDPLSRVDPAFRPALIALRLDVNNDLYTARTLPTMRRLSDGEAPPPGATPPFVRRLIPGAAGAPDVPVYVIGVTGRRGGPPRPAILHIHGGGYIVGRAVDAVARLQKLALKQDCVLVSVDYRLAPETRFPGALNDNYAALRWLHDQAEALGVDRQRIAVMGESAGGGHAAALAIAARDRGEIPLCQQILIYPMLDDRTGSTRQPPPGIGTFVWNSAANRFGWSSLLGVPAGSARVPAQAVPARARNLSGLPPAFIGVGSIDLFVEEDIDYARRLIAAGVATELLVVPGGYHGFDEIAPAAPASLRFAQARDAAIARGFASIRA